MNAQQSSGFSLENLRVLVVDDHPINREFLGAGLKAAVASVELAADGPSAIERCRQCEFDVIILDLHMPRMDGLATANSIRDLGHRSAHARIVALTADTRPEERARLLQAGFDDYLTKPITIRALISAIERLFLPASVANAVEREQPANTTCLVDPARALAAANDDEQLARRMQTMLIEELEGKLPLLDGMIGCADHQAAADLLHQWAGASGYAGATRLAQACRMLRQRLLDGLDSSPGTAYVNLLRIAHGTIGALRRCSTLRRRAIDP
ncbi:MAG: response regulator [Pseudomonadota bacterium]|nr:MAG: response regulator [Pseudomonadota bacterium]